MGVKWGRVIVLALLLSEIVSTASTAYLCNDGNPVGDPPVCPPPETLMQAAILDVVALWRGAQVPSPAHGGHMGPGW